ncbi:MAG: hypothetical protein HY681_08105 [Chloroflexi bacterium]|nr:hypothetical protein [Chloroflexota bacterium]
MRNAIFYLIASTIVVGVANRLGASWGQALLLSLVIPPLLLIALAIARYKRWV